MKNHVKPNRIPNGVFLLLLALAAFPVAAQDSGMAYVPNANRPGGNWVKFTDGVSYKKVLSPAAYGGAITGTVDAIATNPSGNAVALKYTATAPAAAVGAALGKFAVKASGVVAVLGFGVALYDLGKELGYIFDNSTGELVVNKSVPSACSVAPCYESKLTPTTGPYSVWFPQSQLAAKCEEYRISRNDGGINYSRVIGTAPALTCQHYVYGSWQSAGNGYRSSAPLPDTSTPSTLQDFTDTASAKTNWPANSNITRTLEQAQKDYDIFLEYNPVTVSGPASTPGKTSTTTSSTGTTTTSTTTHNHSYDGANVTTSNVTVTNVTNNAGDTTTTTTTETPVKEEPTPDQCEKNPDSIGCSEFGTPEPQQLTQKSIAVQLTPVAFASSATCPANVSASFTVMGRSFSPSFSYASICAAATDYIRPVMLLLALAASAFIFVGGLKSGA